ncbi:MAG: winged helix-turn-helix domain-containing protein [Clostridia bacterium]
MASDLVLTEVVARRFLLGRQGLWPGRRWTGKTGAAAALTELGRLQLDPVSLVARSHDLVLHSRVQRYHPQQLAELVYDERRFFEYGGHLDVYPMEEYPYWDLHKTRRKDEPRVRAFLTEHAELVDEVRRIIREQGPLAAGDIPNDTRVASGRARNAAGLALYNLWLTGELMTHHREGFERIYDLAGRIAAPQEEPLSDAAVRAHGAVEVLRRAGLPTLREWSGTLGYLLYQNLSRTEAAALMNVLMEAGVAVPVVVEGHKAARFVHRDSLDDLAALARDEVPASWRALVGTDREVTFLSPLDNLLARDRMVDLFGFEVIWEIYKPADKRRWGAYTMPIVYQDRLVGRMDPKLDRASRTLTLLGLWIEEDGLAQDPAFRSALRAGLDAFVQFHEAQDLVLAPGALV